MSETKSPTQPALAPPPGVPAEFFNPYTLQPYQALTIVASVIVTTVMVAARVYTKKFIVKAMKWEDYSCVFGWATFMVYVAIEYCIGTHGGGTHMWNLHNSSVQYMRRYTNYSDPVYSLTLFGTKCSILLLILRIFCSVKRDVGYWLTIGLIVVNGIFYIAFFFVPIFQCSPRTKIWTPEESGHCLDVDALYLASATFNVISDIAMLSVPLYLIWNLQMSIQRKIGISTIFTTGGLACISSVLRLIYHVILIKHQDYSFIKFQAALWAIAEIAFGLVCSCLVVLPRLYQHLASIQPHQSGGSTTNQARTDSAPQKSRKQWVQLHTRKDQSLPSLPSEAYREYRSASEDETALESAIEGKPVDVERGV